MENQQSFTLDIQASGVAYLALNRPELHNAFDDQLIAELTEFFTVANSDDRIQIVVLSGNGKSFCAGADINWMKKMIAYTTEENEKDSQKLAEMLHQMNEFTKPLVGKIHGAVMGGGVGLVSTCDHVICEEKTFFALSEVRLGILPAVISPYVISKVGVSHARSTFLSGHRFSAEHAKVIGLVHDVVSKDCQEEAVENYLKQLLKSGPNARVKAKSLIKNIIELDSDQRGVRDYTCELISSVRVSDEGQEGMAALLEKRKPIWVLNEKN